MSDINNKSDKIIAKYNVAINKNTSESEIQWNRYNAMLLFNTILFTAIGFVYREGLVFSKTIVVYLPIAGLASCLFWFAMTLRGFQWINYWIKSAQKIEEEHLLERRGKISDLDPISAGKEYKERIVGWPKTQLASYLLIAVIATLYLILLFRL